MVTGLQKKATPSAKPTQPKNLLPSYVSKASTKPINPSLIVALSHLPADNDLCQSQPAEICTTINNALNVTPHNQIHISAIRWTAKGNLGIIMDDSGVFLGNLHLYLPKPVPAPMGAGLMGACGFEGQPLGVVKFSSEP